MSKISLSLIQNSEDLPKILDIQKAAFEILYFKYRDEETSPYKETLMDIKRRFVMENSFYYFIQLGSIEIGFIRIVTNDNQTKGRISPIAIRPEYENRGYSSYSVYICD